MKKHINVLVGGPSAEHEVSLNSGLEVIAALDRNAYSVRVAVITREKQFYYNDLDSPPSSPSIDDLRSPQTSILMKGPFSPSAAGPLWEGCDVAFLALHGSFGEDGVIQGYLESIGIPYTGSGVYASAVAMNKITSKILYHQNGLATPPYSLFGIRFPDTTPESIAALHGFPCFVKCPQSGSSKLLGRAGTTSELAAMLDDFSRYSSEILIEKAIDGVEFTCGVLDDTSGNPFALPPVEIHPKSSFFDYTAKYTTGASDEIVPAPRPPELLTRIQETAVTVHRILGCRGISRTDMILSDNKLFVLETNTLPGLTANSLIPKSFTATGGTFSGLLDLLIRQALSRTGVTIP
jgi:D-alanine-D-alanine ligase